MSELLPWTQLTNDGIAIDIDLSIYDVDTITNAAHAFTARCYVFVQSVHSGVLRVSFATRIEDDNLRDIVGAFGNALLDAHLRRTIAEETRAIRELLVAQAFSEADLLDRAESEGDEHDDPRGIAR